MGYNSDKLQSLRVVLADDEEPARKRMRAMLEGIVEYDISVVAEAASGKEALQVITGANADLIFLDIQMPVLDGFDVADMLPEPRPPIIFATAYDEYALKAFEVHAVDYLLKPVRKDRLLKAIDKVLIQNTHQRISDMLNERPFYRIGVIHRNDILMIEVKDVMWFEADDKIIYAVTGEQKYRVDSSLQKLEIRLPDFFRLHRACLVNIDHITRLMPWFNNSWRIEMRNGAHLDVARRNTTKLKKVLRLK